MLALAEAFVVQSISDCALDMASGDPFLGCSCTPVFVRMVRYPATIEASVVGF